MITVGGSGRRPRHPNASAYALRRSWGKPPQTSVMKGWGSSGRHANWDGRNAIHYALTADITSRDILLVVGQVFKVLSLLSPNTGAWETSRFLTFSLFHSENYSDPVAIKLDQVKCHKHVSYRKDRRVMHCVLPLRIRQVERNGHVTGRALLPFSSTHPVWRRLVTLLLTETLCLHGEWVNWYINCMRVVTAYVGCEEIPKIGDGSTKPIKFTA
jgi:hypothetical protein